MVSLAIQMRQLPHSNDHVRIVQIAFIVRRKARNSKLSLHLETFKWLNGLK